MQDLLKEEDFLQQPAKPWKRYWIFSIINSLLELGVYFYFNTLDNNGPSIFLAVLLLLFLPAAMVFFMVFGFKKYKYTGQKTTAMGILAFMVCNCITFMTFALTDFGTVLSSESAMIAGIIIGVYTIFFLICWLIAYLILRNKQKKGNIKLLS